MIEASPASALAPALVVENLCVAYGERVAIDDVSLSFPARSTTALIGPSGCGKTTLLRALNRIHEANSGVRTSGRVLLDGADIYAPDVSAVAVRRKVGMVFQRPNPFPTMSIRDDVTTSWRLAQGLKDRKRLDEIAERALRQAALWNEVKDKLDSFGTALSGGQQQRLCIARAIASGPEILLMDEATSALDPIATAQIEDLIGELSKDFTIIAVSHNMQQAARISSYTAFMLAAEDRVGHLVEFGETGRLFRRPHDRRTEDYITGRFG